MRKPACATSPMGQPGEQSIALRRRPSSKPAALLEPATYSEHDAWVLTGGDAGLWSRAAVSSNGFSSGRARRPKLCEGFTLIELVLVTAILATIAAILIPNFMSALDAAKIARAIADIQALETEIASYQILNGTSPNTLGDIGRGTFLDPWGTPYQYLNFANVRGEGQVRKDRFLVPLNSTYDLYTKGTDRQSVPPITASVSQDDIIRANDGAYVGLASKY